MHLALNALPLDAAWSLQAEAAHRDLIARGNPLVGDHDMRASAATAVDQFCNLLVEVHPDIAPICSICCIRA